MKNLLCAWGLEAGFLLLLLVSFLWPQSGAVSLVAAIILVMNVVTWFVAVAGLLSISGGGEIGQKIKGEMQRIFCPARASLMRKLYVWVVRVLSLLTLAFSGWFISLLFYLLTLALLYGMRSCLAEPTRA